MLVTFGNFDMIIFWNMNKDKILFQEVKKNSSDSKKNNSMRVSE